MPAEQLWSLSDEFSFPEGHVSDDPLFSEPRYVCTARLEGLEKGAEYVFSICSPDGRKTPERTFCTADGKKSWSFVAFTDFQTAFNENTAKLMALSRDCNLSICSGDLLDYGAREDEWNWVLSLQKLQKGVFAASPGDHEYWSDKIKPHIPQLPLPCVYNKIFAFPQNGDPCNPNSSYYFRYNNVLFISLDMSDSNTVHNSRLDSEAQWFRQTVASLKGTYDYLVVYQHKSIYGSYNVDSGVRRVLNAQWAPLYKEAGADLVLSGHDHIFSRTRCIDGTWFLDMGSSGRKFRSPEEKLFTDTLHEKVLDLKATGQSMFAEIDVRRNKMTVKVYDFNAELIDSFEVIRKK